MAVSISYVTLGAKDFDAGLNFYDRVLAAVGWSRFVLHGAFAGYGPGGDGGGQTVWICSPFDGGEASFGNGAMLAFGADIRREVDAFHAAAIAAGATDEGAPGPRPQYGPDWYAAYLRDPTGNKLAIVCTAKQEASA
jgi:catechol 2,3-dioxygenase-like lactoylglutathione lyase family enzyme